MEFNARYTLTGFFSLFVMLAVFGFVYWLNNTGSFGERNPYLVHFSVPVSGLSRGSDVLFNGLKVGEVTDLFFDPARPGSLMARILVLNDTPIRTDTVIGVDYQGLTGSASVLMSGGAADSPKLEQGADALPVLEASPAASRSWTQNAGRVLGRLDDLLGRNAGRFDTIFSGLERLAGGGESEAEVQLYDLPAPDDFVLNSAKPDWQLVVAEPTVMLSLNTDKIQQQTSQKILVPIENMQWPDNLPNLFQTKALRSFENAGYADSVLRPGDALDPDFRLAVDLRQFHFANDDNPRAIVDLIARIIDRDGKIVASRQIQSEAPVSSEEPSDVIDAFATVLSSTLKELVNWSVNSI